MSAKCDLCDREAKLMKNPEIEMQEWCNHNIKLSCMELQILTCPECDEPDIFKIFERYKGRILSGQIQKYH